MSVDRRADVFDAFAPRASHNSLARGRPTRSTIASIRSAKPGDTNPALRPEAPLATLFASSTATDQPRRATSRATVRPASPAPTTQTSTSMSWLSAARSGTATTVAAYQVGP